MTARATLAAQAVATLSLVQFAGWWLISLAAR